MKKVFTGIIFVVSLSGCVPHMYHIPNAQNVPLFKEKNEWHASGAISKGFAGGFGLTNGTEAQAAYSATNHIGIFSDFMFTTQTPDGGSAKEKYMDAAIGYYTPVGRFGVVEFFGGFGSSRQHHTYDRYDYSNNFLYKDRIDLSYAKPFLQPALGFTSGAFDAALSCRISKVYFKILQADTLTGFKANYESQCEFGCNKYDYSFIEPAITLRGGWKYVKLQIQALYSTTPDNRDYSDRFDRFHFSAGLYITIASRFWKDALKKKDSNDKNQ